MSSLPTADGRTAARLLASSLRPRRGLTVLAVVVAFATSACALVPPLAIGWLVDRLIDGGGVAAPLAAMVAAVLVGAGLSWWGRLLFAKVAEPTVGELRETVVDHALGLEAGVMEKAGAGELVSRVSDDSRLVSGAVATVLPTVLSAITLLVLSVPSLFGLHWALGVAGLVGVPMYVMSLRWYLPRSAPLYREEREILGRRTAAFLDATSGRATLVAQGWTQAEVGRLAEASDALRQVEDRVFRMLTRYFARNNRAEFVVTAAILVVGFFIVDAGWTTVGAVTAAALLYHRLFDPVAEVIGTFDTIQQAGIALRRLAGVTTAPLRRDSGTEGAARSAGERTGLRLEAASHSFDGSHRVLRDVDITVAPGECVALVGTTGAGKTTAARILAGVLPVQQGQVTLDGTALGELSASGLRPAVCLASQHTHVFAGTLLRNLTLGVPGDVDRARVESALLATGAHWFRELPDGVDTLVGDDGHQLTAHQAQHLALVRLLLLDPSYVILDEATAEAGSTNSRQLEDASATVVRGRGALVIAHRLSQARLADRILVMEGGQVVEDGAHDELVAEGGRYAGLWAAWTGGEEGRDVGVRTP